MTAKDAAKRIGCNRRHIRWLVARGHLVARKVRNKTMAAGYYYDIDRRSVERYARSEQRRGYPRGMPR